MDPLDKAPSTSVRAPAGVLLLIAASLIAWAWSAHARMVPNPELWSRLEERADARSFDLLIMRGAFGADGIPELATFLAAEPQWQDRLRRLHPREAMGLQR